MTFSTHFAAKKTSVNKQNCCDPGERERMIKHGERGVCLKYGEYPDDSECAGADNGADSRAQGMSAAADHSRRDFIQITYRLEQQNVHDSLCGALYHRAVGREQP